MGRITDAEDPPPGHDEEDRHHAYRVLRAFLHALRDHLTVDEAAALAAQLPIFVRGVFYEGWDPSRTPEHARDADIGRHATPSGA